MKVFRRKKQQNENIEELKRGKKVFRKKQQNGKNIEVLKRGKKVLKKTVKWKKTLKY